MTTDQDTNTATTCGLSWCLSPRHRHTDQCAEAALRLQLARIRLDHLRREFVRGRAGGSDLQRAEFAHAEALDVIAALGSSTDDR